MKRFFYHVTIFFLIFIFSCKKNQDSITVLLVKDCTGIYIQSSGKDYHVCNENIVSSYPSGTSLKVIFRKIDNCNISGNICAMYHFNEGWVQIEKIE